MFVESFMTCALMMTPALAFGNSQMTNGSSHLHHVLVQSAEFVHYGRELAQSRFLVIGGDPSLVTSFRDAGLKAFGAFTQDGHGITRHHAVTNVETLSFKSKAFNGVYFMQDNPYEISANDALQEAVRLVSPPGYLLFNDLDYPSWSRLLIQWDWQRMPFRWNGFVMWIRPGGGNPKAKRPKRIWIVIGKSA